jgi:hypothetical protein
MVNLLLVVGGVFIAVVVLVLVLIVIKRSKGKIIINLSKYQFSPGDTIEGTVVLKLKKSVESKGLKVGLSGQQRNTRYGRSSSGGVSRSSRTGSLFNFQQPLDGEKTYPAGEKEYPFKIKIPKDLLASRVLGNDALGTAIKGVQLLSGNVTSVYWYVEAYLDIAGLDLRKEVQVNIG